MTPILISLIGALVSVLAFPPFGLGFMIVLGVALLFSAIRKVDRPRHGFWVGFVYGVIFWGGLMWWLAKLDWTALFLAPLQALFIGLFGWWMTRFNHLSGSQWMGLAMGGWALMELLRYRVPIGGQEWGAAGYALSGYDLVRMLAPTWGTSGITLLVVGLAAMVALAAVGKLRGWGPLLVIIPIVIATVAGVIDSAGSDMTGSVSVAIVQGSTPCPFEDCPPNQRLRTFEQHLALTATIPSGSANLVVWSESSTGSTNADPVNNPEIREQIASEAKRIGAWILVGGDRIVSDTHWINANVLFNPDGEIVGEYRKQHPVPFGEYVPFRTFFTRLVPELSRVPRDMIRGEGPVVFDVYGDEGPYTLGSVISWEGGFSRYARQHAVLGAELMVVATNNESYGSNAPTADQFVGMTRMRAADLGVPLVHAAVTGKSVLLDAKGRMVTGTSDLGAREVVYGELYPASPSIYARTGDLLLVSYLLVAVVVLWRNRNTLVVSSVRSDEEE